MYGCPNSRGGSWSPGPDNNPSDKSLSTMKPPQLLEQFTQYTIEQCQATSVHYSVSQTLLVLVAQICFCVFIYIFHKTRVLTLFLFCQRFLFLGQQNMCYLRFISCEIVKSKVH